MTAVVQHRYGPPQVLAREEIGMPVVGDRDVLLRVRPNISELRVDEWAFDMDAPNDPFGQRDRKSVV